MPNHTHGIIEISTLGADSISAKNDMGQKWILPLHQPHTRNYAII